MTQIDQKKESGRRVELYAGVFRPPREAHLTAVVEQNKLGDRHLFPGWIRPLQVCPVLPWLIDVELEQMDEIDAILRSAIIDHLA